MPIKYITIEDIRALVVKAYEEGFCGCLDLKESYADVVVDGLIETFSEPEHKDLGKWRIWTVEELKAMPVGSCFEHKDLGKGIIGKLVGFETTGMNFASGKNYHFLSNDEPWNKQMMFIGNIDNLI